MTFINRLREILGLKLRDRRIAASDEYWSTAQAHIYGRGTAARMRGERRHLSPHGIHPQLSNRAARQNLQLFHRSESDITTIILHSTGGSDFMDSRRNSYIQNLDRTRDTDLSSFHRIDYIAAHFVVTIDGQVFYTRNIRHTLNNVGGNQGIDIEFAGNFSQQQNFGAAIYSGRDLVQALKSGLPNLRYIHPHGQVQRFTRDRSGNTVRCGGDTGITCGKYHSCPGPAIWTNVGAYSVQYSGLTAQNTARGYQNNGISPRQADVSYQLPQLP